MAIIDLKTEGAFCSCSDCDNKAVLLVTTDGDYVVCLECDSILAYCRKHACELTDELLDALNEMILKEQGWTNDREGKVRSNT